MNTCEHGPHEGGPCVKCATGANPVAETAEPDERKRWEEGAAREAQRLAVDLRHGKVDEDRLFAALNTAAYLLAGLPSVSLGDFPRPVAEKGALDAEEQHDAAVDALARLERAAYSAAPMARGTAKDLGNRIREALPLHHYRAGDPEPTRALVKHWRDRAFETRGPMEATYLRCANELEAALAVQVANLTGASPRAPEDADPSGSGQPRCTEAPTAPLPIPDAWMVEEFEDGEWGPLDLGFLEDEATEFVAEMRERFDANQEEMPPIRYVPLYRRAPSGEPEGGV